MRIGACNMMFARSVPMLRMLIVFFFFDLGLQVDKTAAGNTDGAIVEQGQSATGMTVSGHGRVGVLMCWFVGVCWCWDVGVLGVAERHGHDREWPRGLQVSGCADEGVHVSFLRQRIWALTPSHPAPPVPISPSSAALPRNRNRACLSASTRTSM